jgi:hypothetical protein
MKYAVYRWTALAAAVVALAVLPAACRSEQEEIVPTRPPKVEETPAVVRKAGQIVIDASLEQQPSSKTSLNEDHRVLWSKGDQIRVFNASHPDGVVFTLLDESAGTVKGKFSGDAPGGNGPFFAVYPASSAVRLNSGNLSISLPAEQQAVAGGFGENASLAVARTEALASLDFHNVLGAISFTVQGSKRIARIELESSEALWGTGVVTLQDGGEPALTMTATGSDNKKATLDCTTSQDNSFYLMLPPGTLKKGFNVTLYDTDGNLAFKGSSSAANTIVRSSIVNMPAFQYQAQYNGAFFSFPGFGLLDGVNAGGSLSAAQAFEDAPSQYATSVRQGSTRKLRVQDWEKGLVATYTTDYSLEVGNSYQIAIEKLQGSSYTSESRSFTLVRKNTQAAWFVSADGKQGFILPMED